jgi:hypothetical protein
MSKFTVAAAVLGFVVGVASQWVLYAFLLNHVSLESSEMTIFQLSIVWSVGTVLAVLAGCFLLPYLAARWHGKSMGDDKAATAIPTLRLLDENDNSRTAAEAMFQINLQLVRGETIYTAYALSGTIAAWIGIDLAEQGAPFDHILYNMGMLLVSLSALVAIARIFPEEKCAVAMAEQQKELTSLTRLQAKNAAADYVAVSTGKCSSTNYLLQIQIV